MRKLNFQHRAVDRSTNVLAFPLGEPMQPDGRRHLGDIVLAYETVVREAARDAKPLDAHVAHLLVHGLLHLLGTIMSRKVMRKRWSKSKSKSCHSAIRTHI